MTTSETVCLSHDHLSFELMALKVDIVSTETWPCSKKHHEMSKLMRLWNLSYMRPAKAQASLRICAVLLEPLLFAHMKHGSRRRVQPKIRHLAPLDGCSCVFEE